MGRQHLGDLPARAVDDRREDVRGALAGKLDDPLAEVGLHRRQPGRLERVVQLDLLGDHRLALGDHLHARRRAISSTAPTASAGGGRADHAASAARHRLLEALEQLRRARHGIAADRAGAVDALRPSRGGAPRPRRETEQVAPRGLQRGAQPRCRRAPCRCAPRAPCRRRRRCSRRPALALEQLGQRRGRERDLRSRRPRPRGA